MSRIRAGLHGERVWRDDDQGAQNRLRTIIAGVGPRGGSWSCTARKNWAWRVQYGEPWIDQADEVLIETQVEERISEHQLRAHATKSYSQWLETAMEKRSKSCAQMDNPNYHFSARHGLPQQHHTATEHAGTHGGMERKVEQGHGVTPHPTAANAIPETTTTFHHAT